MIRFSLPIGFLLLAASAVAQTTWYVDDDAPGDPGPGDTSISDPLEDGTLAHPFDAVQEAIDASASGDTILILDGAYSGTGNYNLDPAGRDLTIRSENGPAACIFTPGHAIGAPETVLRCDDGETTATALEGITVVGGGRALVLTNGSGATVRNLVVRQAENGIYSDGGGEIIVEDSTFSLCEAGTFSVTFSGAAIFSLASGPVRISGSTFDRNSAYFSGGALYLGNAQSIVIDHCSFVLNACGHSGGAGFLEAPSVRVSNTLARSNSAVSPESAGQAFGGAFRCASPDSLFVNCDFERNAIYVRSFGLAAGGGVSASGVCRAQNSLFVGHQDESDGSSDASVIAADTLILEGCTLVNNSEWRREVLHANNLTMRNTIVWDDDSGLTLDEMITAGTIDAAYCVARELLSGPGNLAANPLFLDPDGPDDDPTTFEDNDYRLRVTSPCVDAGDSAAVPPDALDLDNDGDTTEPLPIDLDGNPRIVDVRCIPDGGAGGPPTVDMGAYEAADFMGGDCNANGMDDCDEIASGAATDCDLDGILDECEPDCDGDGIPDDCENAPDCNGNGVPDDCDTAFGASADCDGNGVPDECSLPAPLSGYAVELSSSSRVNVPADATLSFTDGESITLEAWIRPVQVDLQRAIFTKNRVGFENYTLMVDEGALVFAYVNAAGTQTFRYATAPVVVANEWQHVAVTYTFGGAALSMYLDGAPVAGAWDITPDSGPHVLTQALKIGHSMVTSSVVDRSFIGIVDDARLWRVIRSQFEIQSAMNAPLVGNEFGLESYWPFDDGAGEAAEDAAGSNDAALVSAIWVALLHCPCPGDINGDGRLDLLDLSIVLAAFGVSGAGDIDGDGDTDLGDITILLARFGGGATDCNGNGVPDDCETDCNLNGVADECDIAGGGSADCNGDGVPDECQPDCNGNGQPDDCDLAGGVSTDCNGNSIPDECDIAGGASADCNGNGVPDSCDLGSGASNDCDGNGIPDECQPDCDGDGTPDICEGSPDCNQNGLPDECDISGGTSEDCDGDGVPDECLVAGQIPGYAIDFDVERLYVPHDASLQFGNGESITIEAWLRPDSDSPQCIISKGTVNAENYYLMRVNAGGRIRFGYRGLGGTDIFRYETDPLVPIGEWHHVAVTHVFGTSTITVYIDGEPVPGSWVAAPTTGPLNETEQLSIGLARASLGTPTREFDGLIDDVRLWRTIRSQSEIQSALHTRLNGDEPGLESYWPLDEGAGETVGDAAGTNDGAISNVVPDWVALYYCP